VYSGRADIDATTANSVETVARIFGLNELASAALKLQVVSNKPDPESQPITQPACEVAAMPSPHSTPEPDHRESTASGWCNDDDKAAPSTPKVVGTPSRDNSCVTDDPTVEVARSPLVWRISNEDEDEDEDAAAAAAAVGSQSSEQAASDAHSSPELLPLAMRLAVTAGIDTSPEIPRRAKRKRGMRRISRASHSQPTLSPSQSARSIGAEGATPMIVTVSPVPALSYVHLCLACLRRNTHTPQQIESPSLQPGTTEHGHGGSVGSSNLNDSIVCRSIPCSPLNISVKNTMVSPAENDGNSDSDGLIEYCPPTLPNEEEPAASTAASAVADTAAPSQPQSQREGSQRGRLPLRSPEEFRTMVVDTIRRDSVLHLRVLQFLPIDVNAIIVLLKDQGIRHNKGLLVDALNAESIT
jgi:hypothetical protein